jgi:hypothetical protein
LSINAADVDALYQILCFLLIYFFTGNEREKQIIEAQQRPAVNQGNTIGTNCIGG